MLTPNGREPAALAGLVTGPDAAPAAAEARAALLATRPGAGDVFNGVLAARLVDGADLVEATRAAVEAASRSVAQPGAR